jgi:hypothetical protein
MKTEGQILKKAEQLQEDCHKVVGDIMGRSQKVSYQDATNVWLFNKLAELQNRIEELEKRKIFTNNITQ